jgi:hypothetical protein
MMTDLASPALTGLKHKVMRKAGLGPSSFALSLTEPIYPPTTLGKRRYKLVNCAS